MNLSEEIKELLQKLEPIYGQEKTRNLWHLSLISEDAQTAFENRNLLQLLADTKAKINYQEKIRLPPPPQKEILNGEYNLGKVIYPNTPYANFGLRENEFIKHILITGMTGTGKTNLAQHLIKQLSKKQKPFLIFDWKQNYKNLKKQSNIKQLNIIRPGDPKCQFKFNPLIPPEKVHPKHWLAMLVDVIKHAFFVAHGVEFFFRKGIDQLYTKYKIYQNHQTEYYPTFEDLEKSLRKEFVRGREMLWMSSAKRVLASLTFSGLLGEILNIRQHPKISYLLEENVVFEMDNLATIEKIFLVESLLLWIYHFRKNQGKRNQFKHAIIIEEAHHILSGKKEYELGEEPITETVIRMIREFGESIIAIDQEPSKISNSILANTNTKICFNLGNGKDIDTITKALNLSKDERRCIDKLQVGHAIIKMKQRFHQPIHVKIPLATNTKIELNEWGQF